MESSVDQMCRVIDKVFGRHDGLASLYDGGICPAGEGLLVSPSLECSRLI